MKVLLVIIFFLRFSQLYSQEITQIESLQSLYIEIFKEKEKLGNATGFIIKSSTRYYLVTNYHVITQKNPINNDWLYPHSKLLPDRIEINCISKNMESYVTISQSLYDNNRNPIWYQRKIGKEIVDVVQIPLRDTSEVKFFPINYKTSGYDNVLITPTDRIFIIGFPLGFKGDQELPIWKSGLIASEPDFDQEGKPIIWVDAITFPGMSGSPAYFMSKETVRFKDGKYGLVRGPSKFMGVFSHTNSNVYGALWKASFLAPIFDSLP
ncbi:MAG: trypsin-like peptidase domain-containing protein [Cyclobacteriaceae bacterium]|nr:trypsin-like peptidase domain-containing protein [Cyclobacteriaceae bacterium]